MANQLYIELYNTPECSLIGCVALLSLHVACYSTTGPISIRRGPFLTASACRQRRVVAVTLSFDDGGQIATTEGARCDHLFIECRYRSHESREGGL